MRTLKLNESEYWVTKSIGEVDVVDSDGYYTGEKKIEYDTPYRIKLHLYPASGEIVKRLFGEHIDLDMITSSTTVDLEVGTLLFKDKPIGDYYESYDYELRNISKSLNVYQYGFRGRV